VEKNKNLSNKIKESFESQSFGAPEDMWSSLSAGLDESAIDKKIKESFSSSKFSAPAFDFSSRSSSTSALDKKIAESFEQTVVAAPESEWNGIEDKLDVDIVWDKLSDKIVVYNRVWTKWVAAASIAILVSVLPSTIKNQPITNEMTFLSPLIVSENTSSTETELLSQNNLMPIAQNTKSDVENPSIIFEEQEILEQGPIFTQLVESNSKTNVSSSIIEFIEPTEINPLSNKWSATELNSNRLTQNYLVSKNPIERKKEKSIKSGFRIGVIAGLSSSWILDNDTRESFDKTSLNDSKLSLGQMYGVNADYYFNDKNGVEANILVNSRSKNRMGYYEHGVYKVRKTEINYFKTALLYNRRINFYGKKNNHSITLGGGPYLGLNRNSNVTENETLTSINSQFKKVNYGLTLRLGEEIEWSKFVLGYGVNSELGLRNIFQGETTVQSDMNFTNNFDLGLFVSLKYKLF